MGIILWTMFPFWWKQNFKKLKKKKREEKEHYIKKVMLFAYALKKSIEAGSDHDRLAVFHI